MASKKEDTFNSLASNEMQMKTKMENHHRPIRFTKNIVSDNFKCW